ncbi:MAG: hypothetical protein KAX39_03070 [candidate division Zixibacteria bacterium]|nr:hypothetical protein [candidate division Zixibacteria bacterium]
MKNLNRHLMKTKNNQTQNLGEKKMEAKKLILGLVALSISLSSILSFAASVSANIPQMINYQGVLTDPGGCPEDGEYDMVFRIYNAETSGDSLWGETHSSVSVTQGNFNVLLGSSNPIPGSLFLNAELWLGVKVGEDTEMEPRQRIASVGYAFQSEFSDTAEFARISMPDDDWTISGDDIYRLEGNVGIGTTNPMEKLEVSGAIRANGGFPLIIGTTGYAYVPANTGHIANYYKNTPDTYDNGFMWRRSDNGFPGGANEVDLMKLYDDGVNHILYINANVGIGTTSPGANLEIKPSTGATHGQGLRLSNGAGGHSWELKAGSPGVHNDYFTLTDITTSNAVRMTVDSGGNVGIGTTSPAYKLDVNGDIRATGNIYGNFSGTIDNADKVDGIHASTTPTANYLYPLDANAKIPNARLYTGSGNGLDADKLDGKHNGELTADIWDGHNWGDTYPNADKVDGIHGTQFLRNDQSGNLWGNLSVSGDLSVEGRVDAYSYVDLKSYTDIWDLVVWSYLTDYGDAFIWGDLTVWGTKEFLQLHPRDTTKTIHYVCLEGGEAGTYVRGSAQLQGGVAIISLPEHFGLVTSENGLTAQVTAKDGTAKGYLYIESVTPSQLTVKESGGGLSNAKFDYFVQGVRIGHEDHQVIQDRSMLDRLELRRSLLKKGKNE